MLLIDYASLRISNSNKDSEDKMLDIETLSLMTIDATSGYKT